VRAPLRTLLSPWQKKTSQPPPSKRPSSKIGRSSTTARRVALLVSSLHPYDIRVSFSKLYIETPETDPKICRQCSIHRRRRIHVHLRTRAAKGTGSRDTEKQEHVWHGKSAGGHHGHSGVHDGAGGISVVCVGLLAGGAGPGGLGYNQSAVYNRNSLR
jgi:hypothetical protein